MGVIGLCSAAAIAAAGSLQSDGDRPVTLSVFSHEPVDTGTSAFVDVTVIPMDQERLLAHYTVVIAGGRIVALGPTTQVAVPAGATTIDGQGKFLIPGLADMHAHLRMGAHMGSLQVGRTRQPIYAPPSDSAAAETRLFLWLANGVTTVRNMDYYQENAATDYTGNVFGPQALQLRARSATGREWLPHLYTAGQWGPRQYIGPDEGKGPRPRLDSIAAYLATYKAAGYDFVKVHDEDHVILDSVLAIARRIGIPVTGHVPSPARVDQVLQGYASIEHPLTEYDWYLNNWYRSETLGVGKLVDTMRRAHVWHCVTDAHYAKWHEQRPNLVKIEQDSGVKLLLGTDELPWQGVMTRELQSLVADGLTPYQALVSGTRNVASYFGTLAESGTIEVGKRADLVLLTGNPLQDIRYTAQPAGVMLGGRWLSRAEIDRRVATLTLPVYRAGAMMNSLPLQSYWSNVVEDLNTLAGVLPASVTLDDSVQQRQLLQRQALADSLGTSIDYDSGTVRVLRVIAQQLGEDRVALTAGQRAKFDTNATVWMQQQRAAGYSVQILLPAPSPHESGCTATVLGIVMNAAHKGIAGIWVQDGNPQSGFMGQRVKTDRYGRFDFAVSDDAKGAIYVFRDSSTTSPSRSVASYSKKLLQIKECVATPITIVVPQ